MCEKPQGPCPTRPKLPDSEAAEAIKGSPQQLDSYLVERARQLPDRAWKVLVLVLFSDKGEPPSKLNSCKDLSCNSHVTQVSHQAH